MHNKTSVITVVLISLLVFTLVFLIFEEPVTSKVLSSSDAVTWVQIHPVNSPSERSEHAMAYDSRREYIVVFGGYGSTRYMNDTWEWNGVNWVQRFPDVKPSERTDSAMAYDVGCECIVLFGGAAHGTPQNAAIP